MKSSFYLYDHKVGNIVALLVGNLNVPANSNGLAERDTCDCY